VLVKRFFFIISFYRWEYNLLLSFSLLIESDAKCFPNCKITALPKQLSPMSISLNRWHSRQRNLLREINPRGERALFSNWWTYGLKVIDSWCNRIAWKLAGVIWKARVLRQAFPFFLDRVFQTWPFAYQYRVNREHWMISVNVDYGLYDIWL